MSLEMATERVCYVRCNLCNTILAVSVPSSSLYTIVTVRCGHCGNLLSVNMAGSLQSLPLPDNHQKQQLSLENMARGSGSSSSSKPDNNTSNKFSSFEPIEHEPPRITPIRPPEKRQRVPSAYNRFINGHIFLTFTLG
ncbi:putative axial regulator YABBY 2 isoform X5 [Rhodamnia argentea]|uniref:Axial regulator YABBY 2 isoform X5 n=1 Tax=Rhodamnia argentea TaxID=178133 RepID=A0ABM3HUC6_9MYRT|nr:putative axial regulator YABBY 2 isoform X5 [Rhodamnia argentea]